MIPHPWNIKPKWPFQVQIAKYVFLKKIREIGFSGLSKTLKYASQALYFGLFRENVESAQSSIKSRTYDDKKITHNAKVVVGY